MCTPRQAEMRGSHVSLRHEAGSRIIEALKKSGSKSEVRRWADRMMRFIKRKDSKSDPQVIPDWRSDDVDPNKGVIRFGITPLYTTFSEIHRALNHMRAIVEERKYLEFDPVARADKLEAT